MLEPRPKVPLETATVAESLIRLAEPKFTVPPLTVRFAPRVPLREVVPVEAVAEPAPKFALTVPPFNAYVPAVNVPLPPNVPPVEIEKLPTVSLKVDMPNVPPATVTAAPFAKRSAAPRFIVPLFTLTVVAPKVPFNTVVPVATVAVPAPKFALTVPPFNA